jgi:hypothetical protein
MIYRSPIFKPGDRVILNMGNVYSMYKHNHVDVNGKKGTVICLTEEHEHADFEGGVNRQYSIQLDGLKGHDHFSGHWLHHCSNGVELMIETLR